MRVWVAFNVEATGSRIPFSYLSFPEVWRQRKCVSEPGSGVFVYYFDDSLREQVLATNIPWLTILGVEE